MPAEVASELGEPQAVKEFDTTSGGGAYSSPLALKTGSTLRCRSVRGMPSGGYSGWRSKGSQVTAAPNRRSSASALVWPTRQNGQMKSDQT